jgi:hypothetical protein
VTAQYRFGSFIRKMLKTLTIAITVTMIATENNKNSLCRISCFSITVGRDPEQVLSSLALTVHLTKMDLNVVTFQIHTAVIVTKFPSSGVWRDII